MLTCKACKPAARNSAGEISPHGFLRRTETKPDYRGEVYYGIWMQKATELHLTCNRLEHAALWRKLCKLEATIIHTIGGETFNQW